MYRRGRAKQGKQEKIGGKRAEVGEGRRKAGGAWWQKD